MRIHQMIKLFFILVTAAFINAVAYGSLNKPVRDTSGNIVTMTFDAAKKYCDSRGSHLPTMREYADFFVSRGRARLKESAYKGKSIQDPLVVEEMKKFHKEERLYAVPHMLDTGAWVADYYFSPMDPNEAGDGHYSPESKDLVFYNFWTSSTDIFDTGGATFSLRSATVSGQACNVLDRADSEISNGTFVSCLADSHNSITLKDDTRAVRCAPGSSKTKKHSPGLGGFITDKLGNPKVSWSTGEPEAYCKAAGGRLPSISDLAQYAGAHGAKGIRKSKLSPPFNADALHKQDLENEREGYFRINAQFLKSPFFYYNPDGFVSSDMPEAFVGLKLRMINEILLVAPDWNRYHDYPYLLKFNIFNGQVTPELLTSRDPDNSYWWFQQPVRCFFE